MSHEDNENTEEQRRRRGELLGLSKSQLMDLVLLREKETMTDPLTGLKSRRFMIDHLEHLCGATARSQWSYGESSSYASHFAILFVDIDNFKKINDGYGHDVGDEVLKAVAQVLKAHMVRPLDTVARWGGEEILVSMQETGTEGALINAERLREAVEAFSFEEYPDLRVTISIGVASTEDTSPTVEKIVKAADEGLYVAKQGGRNRIAVSDKDK